MKGKEVSTRDNTENDRLKEETKLYLSVLKMSSPEEFSFSSLRISMECMETENTVSDESLIF